MHSDAIQMSECIFRNNQFILILIFKSKCKLKEDEGAGVVAQMYVLGIRRWGGATVQNTNFSAQSGWISLCYFARVPHRDKNDTEIASERTAGRT